MKDHEVGGKLQRFLDCYYQLNPVNATFTGIHTYDEDLPDWTCDGLVARRDILEDLSTRLDGTASEASCDDELAQAFLKIQIAEIDSSHFYHHNPSLYIGEAVFGVISLMLRDFAPVIERASSVEQRLLKWPAFLDNARHVLQRNEIPTMWRERALRECTGAAFLVGDGLDAWIRENDLEDTIRKALEGGGGRARTAVHAFARWLQTTTNDAPIRPCGPDLLDLLLNTGHRCLESRPELLEQAHDALAESRSRLTGMIRAAGADSPAEIAERLQAQHPKASEYTKTFTSLWQACREVAIANKLVTWPDYPITYRTIPGWAEAAAPNLYFLFYRSPPAFDQLPSIDYLVPGIGKNTRKAQRPLRATNTSVIKLNHVVHHGAIGHHVQNYYAYSSNSPIGQIGAIDCASRIAFFGAGTMAEGWACYATDLMEEYGFLSPLERIAQQENRVKQLVRAVVDLEIHQGSMRLADAVQFMTTNAGLTKQAADQEIVKMSMFPATGMMYWYGTRAIHELRETMSGAEGPAFSLQRFHDTFLSHGSIPVTAIKSRMTRGVRR